jgi:hypothetical protein
MAICGCPKAIELRSRGEKKRDKSFSIVVKGSKTWIHKDGLARSASSEKEKMERMIRFQRDRGGWK